jgi:4-hydroxybenzoate polyprenyltransferase
MGTACVFAAMAYLGAPFNPLAGLSFMGVVFFVYIINRFTDIKEDFANDIQKVVFFSNRKVLYKIALATIFLVGVALVSVNKLSFFHLLLISTGVFYSYRLIPWYKKNRGIFYYRIKDLPLAKNLVVSILWGTSIFAVPILFTQNGIGNSLIITFLMISLTVSTFTNTLFSDIQDIVGDILSRSNTLPAVFGATLSYKVLLAVNLTWLAGIIAFFAVKIIDGYHFGFLAVMALYPLVYIFPHVKKWAKRTTVELLMELDLLVMACGLTLLSIAY